MIGKRGDWDVDFCVLMLEKGEELGKELLCEIVEIIKYNNR